MFFVLSKTLSFVEQPLNWVLALLLLALLLKRRRPRTARAAMRTAVALFVLLGITVLPLSILRWLEDTHPSPAAAVESFYGLIVLGGSTESGLTGLQRRQVSLNDSAERLTETVRLMRQHPHLRVVYTGFSNRLNPVGISEAAAAATFFAEQGADTARVVYEDRARNTYENAAFSMALPQVDHRRPWLLVTSAAHMPRALAVFRKLGWNVEPYAVDFVTGEPVPLWSYSIADGANHWQTVLHELIGLAVYKMSDRI